VRRTPALAAGAAVLLSTVLSATAASAAVAPAATTSWASEFNGANGTRADPRQWTAVTGGGGWGNHDLETYTTSPRNSVVRDGKLVVTARRETVTGPDGVTRGYTSARLETRGKFTMQYGTVSARIKLPQGAGLFPAFWMLGNDFDQVGWPASGEFDVMENLGQTPRVVTAGLHGPGMTGGVGSTAYRSPTSLSTAYHVYSMTWKPDSVSFSLDGKVFVTKRKADLPAGATWVFDHPFYLLLNLAVGGDWPKTPPATTTFPASMYVDWVRVTP
jgi:beta-glucanase (GH16 family)